MAIDPAVAAALQQLGIGAPAPAPGPVPVPAAPPLPGISPVGPPVTDPAALAVAPPGPLAPPAAPPVMPPPPGTPAAFAPPMPLAPPGPGPGVPPGEEGMPVPLSPEEEVEQERLSQEGELARQVDSEDDFLGEGARPRRGSSMPHPLEVASSQMREELRGNAKRLAGELFPNGPAGTVLPSKDALGAYMRRHWDDPQFRQTMLDRMAPKGPDGHRVPWGVKAYLKLYQEAVAPHRLPFGSGQIDQVPQAPLPQTFQAPQPSQPPPAQPPAQMPMEETGGVPPAGPNALGV